MASIPWAVSTDIYELKQLAIETWHSYRVPILLTTFAALTILKIYLALTQDREGLLVLPQIYGAPESRGQSPSNEKPTPVVANDHTPRKTVAQRRIRGELPQGKTVLEGPREIQCLVFFSSVATTTAKIAGELARDLQVSFKSLPTSAVCSFGEPQVLDLAEVDYDEHFIAPPTKTTEDGKRVDFFYLFLLPSYNFDTINDTFLEHLKDTHHDFRIDTAPLARLLGYSVFGLGDREGWPTEEEGFCFQAKELDRWMAKLTGRKRAFPLGVGDSKSDMSDRLKEWSQGVVEVLGLLAQTGVLGEGVPGSGDPVESDDEDVSDEDDGEVVFGDIPRSDKAKPSKPGRIEDLEDLGSMIRSSQEDGAVDPTRPPIPVDFTNYAKSTSKRPATQAVKEMVPESSPTYKTLTKQGYTIVGSHSGVKICRWTKSALRGRGSCYKFSFYGINSHQCMETTPSLSCSSRCVFCWRHGSNPVSTSWRWVVDAPELIFDGVKAGHYQKIKMMRGVPGVRAERFAEAMQIRHCALSLVGEPIFYPHINKLLAMLHAERISSFLVCNAQHPDQLAALKHVTQLYVSIDASNKESLRKIDRPLHRDFWERFQQCMEILRERRFRQRTVFRLTLVKGFNIDEEVMGYADLVEKAQPCFVEIKGVTYCGTSTSSKAGLTMSNVPWHYEVCDFVRALETELNSRGLRYGIAAEHAHSCCVLLASERFKRDGKWHTIIDYKKFFELLEAKGPDGDFSPEDYMGPETPEWAAWGNGGFDPRDQRVDRKGRPIEANLYRSTGQ